MSPRNGPNIVQCRSTRDGKLRRKHTWKVPRSGVYYGWCYHCGRLARADAPLKEAAP